MPTGPDHEIGDADVTTIDAGGHLVVLADGPQPLPFRLPMADLAAIKALVDSALQPGDVGDIITDDAAKFALAGAMGSVWDALQFITGTGAVAVPASTLTILANVPEIVSGVTVLVPAASLLLAAYDPAIALNAMPFATFTLTAGAPEVVSGASVDIPAVVLSFSVLAPVIPETGPLGLLLALSVDQPLVGIDGLLLALTE